MESFIGQTISGPGPRRLHSVICGGESDPKARPMHPDWARILRDQCHAVGTSFFFKQWGSWTVSIDRDDPDWRQDTAGC
ncbi:phage protein Gp37/Gp68 [Phaeobacter inhibens]|nr:phage protein Gp37/Gp68 [Phaeobacter inhibens]